MASSTGSPAPPDPAGADALRSWVALVLMIAFAVTAASIMNRLDPEPSFLVGMSILGAGVAVLLLLAGLAVRFGLRAQRAGNPRGIIPATLGGTLGGFALLLATATLVAHAFGFE